MYSIIDAASDNKLSDFNLMTELDNNPTLRDLIRKDVEKYFDIDTDANYARLQKAKYVDKGLIERIRVTNDELTEKDIETALVKAYTYNSFIHKMETVIIAYGDLVQYNHAKEEFHKRNAGAGSTGKLFRNDKVAIDFINSRGRGWAKRKGKKEKTLTYSGEIDTAVLEDNIIPTAYLKDITDAITEDITKRYAKATLPDNIKAERIKEEVGDYFDKMKEGDAQGWITFDMYRILAYLEGNWSDEQEKLYKQIINEEEVSITDTLTFFPVRKFQYWGTLKNEYASLNAFHKFSLINTKI